MNIPDSTKIAAVRAIVGGFVMGGLAFFAAWAQTDDPKLLISAFGTAFLTCGAWRLGVEGYIDRPKP